MTVCMLKSGTKLKGLEVMYGAPSSNVLTHTFLWVTLNHFKKHQIQVGAKNTIQVKR